MNYNFSGVTKENADVLVYMSGGYLGDTSGNIKESYKRYVKYFKLGNYFLKNNKEIVFLGVGGGPIKNIFLRKNIINLMNHASRITVRDVETREYYKSHGVKTSIITSTDTALILNEYALPKLDKTILEDIKKKSKGRKIIFIHVFDKDYKNVKIENKVIPMLNKYINEKQDKYFCIIGTDYVCDSRLENLSIYKKINCDKMVYKYENTLQFSALLQNVDSVITTKLHVGIVSSVFSKGVVSFPIHKYKTKRFYKQINEDKRCIPLGSANDQIVYESFCEFMDKPVVIKNSLFEKAKNNLII